jgi:quaternary ammonium compound-resistance protein SugE
MPWVYLLAAGFMEIAWAVSLKQSQGFSQLLPSVIFVLTSIFSIILLSLALKQLPLGTAYAVWTGIGACGVAIVGMVFFGESTSPVRIAFLLMIGTGIMGLKFTV